MPLSHSWWASVWTTYLSPFTYTCLHIAALISSFGNETFHSSESIWDAWMEQGENISWFSYSSILQLIDGSPYFPTVPSKNLYASSSVGTTSNILPSPLRCLFWYALLFMNWVWGECLWCFRSSSLHVIHYEDLATDAISLADNLYKYVTICCLNLCTLCPD